MGGLVEVVSMSGLNGGSVCGGMIGGNEGQVCTDKHLGRWGTGEGECSLAS